jgi:hypothetical protein
MIPAGPAAWRQVDSPTRAIEAIQPRARVSQVSQVCVLDPGIRSCDHI